jgi:hypothetical protein
LPGVELEKASVAEVSARSIEISRPMGAGRARWGITPSTMIPRVTIFLCAFTRDVSLGHTCTLVLATRTAKRGHR